MNKMSWSFNPVQIMANLDVGVDAKLRLKFVTHNKSVSGYFTSHGTETIRQDG